MPSALSQEESPHRNKSLPTVGENEELRLEEEQAKTVRPDIACRHIMEFMTPTRGGVSSLIISEILQKLADSTDNPFQQSVV